MGHFSLRCHTISESVKRRGAYSRLYRKCLRSLYLPAASIVQFIAVTSDGIDGGPAAAPPDAPGLPPLDTGAAVAFAQRVSVM